MKIQVDYHYSEKIEEHLTVIYLTKKLITDIGHGVIVFRYNMMWMKTIMTLLSSLSMLLLSCAYRYIIFVYHIIK